MDHEQQATPQPDACGRGREHITDPARLGEEKGLVGQRIEQPRSADAFRVARQGLQRQ